MKRAIAMSLFLIASLSLLPPAAFAEEKEIRYDPLWDTVLLFAGLGGAALTQFTLGGVNAGSPLQDVGSLCWIDAVTLFPYDEGLSNLSVGAAGLTVLWPAIFALVCEDGQTLPAAAVYVEALSVTFIAKDFIKWAFPKTRPYAYGGGSLSGELLEEVNEGFPSGHTALAFCAATSFAVLSLELAPANPATPWLVAGGYCLAAGTGALRVLSGNHFVTDVAAGAALGSLVGWLVTEAHIHAVGAEGDGIDVGGGAKLSLHIAPSAIMVTVR